MKKNLQFLALVCCITLLIIALDFPAFISSLNDMGITKEKVDQVYNFKSKESELWARLKGEETLKKDSTVAINLDELLKVRASPIPTANIAVSPTPNINIEAIRANPNVLIIGDSMMLEGFGPKLESDLLQYKDIKVTRRGKYSTGLNKVSYFDWYKATVEAIDETNANVLIVMFGANDGQDIVAENGKSVQYAPGSQAWKEVYAQRVSKYMTLASAKTEKIYWVGHPIPRDNDFYQKLSMMNEVYANEAKNFPKVTFIPTWERFAVNGKFSLNVADDNGLNQIVKYGDGVHVTPHGGKILSDLVIKKMVEELQLIKN
jgi:hypothetical protein